MVYLYGLFLLPDVHSLRIPSLAPSSHNTNEDLTFALHHPMCDPRRQQYLQDEARWRPGLIAFRMFLLIYGDIETIEDVENPHMM